MANLSRIVESLVKHDAIATDNPNKAANMIKCFNELGYKSLGTDGHNFIENKSSLKKIENPKLQLTENGVLILYNQLHKQILNMQVIFLFRTNIYWYLRLSDGKFVTPIIRLYKKNCSELFSVGAVLSIKEVVICNHELDALHVLEDPQISRVLIKDYHVLEPHTSFSSILGQLNPDFTYRDSIQYISDLLIKNDHKLEKYFKQEAKHYEQLKEDGERFRERGNALFKKKNVDQAIIHFDMAKQKNQYDFRVWSDLSQVHFNSGEFKKAEDEALMAIKLNPFFEKAYHQAGKAAMKQSGKEAGKETAVEYTRSGILICNEDGDLQKLLEEFTGEPSVPKPAGLTAFCSEKGLEKLRQLVEEKKATEKKSEVTKEVNKATTIETNSLDGSINEVLLDKDSSSKCSWERLETKADVVPPSDDDNIATVIDSMEDLNEKSDSISTCNRSGGIATFNLNIKNFNKLTDAKYSQTCYVRNFPWNILFVPKLDRGTILMVFVIQCNGDTDSTSWSCDASVVVKGKTPAIWKIDKKKFCSKEIKMVFYPSMDWDEVINPENGYIKDDTITVEVHLKVRTKKIKQINTAIEEEARKEEAKHKEEERKKKLRAIPKDPYHKTIYEGRKLYEQGQYCQALELFGKPVPANRNINATKLKLEGVIVQFLLGICKIQSGKSFILDGMDIMKSLIDAKSTFPSAPAAHYWLGIGFERIYLLKLAHHHGFLCSDSLNSSSKYKGISWPGSDDFIPETVPDKLARHAKELLGRVASTKPTPKARCRFKNCIGTQSTPYAKEEIYSSDPDFKGYLDIICEENCSISYHPCCWKAYKESQEDYHGKMTDKDFVDQSCMTPDCCGKICSIHIYDETERLKNVIQKDKDKKEIKGSSILSKQKNKKDKKEKRTTKNDSKTKNKTENQNEANKENRDKENVKEESISKKDSLGTNQEDHKARFIIPTQSAAPLTPKKEKPPSTAILPIDPESLATEKVTILVPDKEDENVWEKTTTKKNKKKKKNKQSNNTNLQQTDLLGDPIEADKAQRNEYLARLRLLKQQREFYNDSKSKNGNGIHNKIPLSQSQYKQVLQWLDPENPFYLPQHLRDNPEELEYCLQTKMTTTTGPDVSQDTIVTLLSFMYDWLKEQGPMSINDARIREYVVENFPPEGKNHINMCGSIKEFLMQSIDFALIDDVICVRDHVVQAQELTLKTTLERMSSKYLLSDGKKAKKLVHLLDEDFKSPEDVKSTSSTSSSSHIIDSTLSLNSYNASVSNSTNHSVSLEAQKLSTPLLELNNNANSPKEIKKMSTGGMGGLDDFEMPEMTNGSKGENQITGSQDTVVVSSAVGVHRDLDTILSGGAIPVSKTLPNNCVNRTPPDSSMIPDVKDSSDVVFSPTITLAALAQETEDEEVFNSDEDEDIFQENQNVTLLEAEVSQLRRELQQQESQCQVLSVQNEELSDKFHQHKTRANLDLGLLKKQIEELNEKLKSAEAERASVSALRESEQKKFNSERSRMQEEVKNLQSRNASLELQHDRANDRIHELEQKLSNEMVAHAQLKEEMKSLQDSLISSSRRSHEAEVKYLCTKKDLVEQHLNRTVDRLSKEVARMRQLLVHANDNTVPDHSTLSQSIVAWDAHIANIQMVIKSFLEQGVRFLGLVNQGRPLSALPAGDLQVPPIEDINVADLLCLGQKAKANITGSGLSTNLSLGASNNVDVSDRPSTPTSVLKHGGLGAHYLGSPTAGMDMHPAYARNGPTANAFNNASLINGGHGKTLTAQIGNWPDSHQLFVGQLPWNYSEDDMKKFFTEQFGEVVSVTIYDKHRNPDGKTVPKYGFVVFRNAEDRDKALNKKPIMIKNHVINVQAKEPSNIHPSKTTGPPPGLALPSHLCLAASLVTENATGSNLSPPVPMAVQPIISLTSNTTASTTTNATTPGAASSTAVRCLEDISLKANSETIKTTGVTRSGAVATPTQSANTTPTSTKPKFQHLTTSNISTIGTPPPKLVRPQPSRPGGGLTTSLSQSTTARGGSRSGVSSVEDSGVSGGNAYKKLVEVCKQRLGQEYAHPEIYTALREVRQRNNSTLSGLSLDVIVDRVRIQLRSRRPGSGGASVAPWASLMHSSSNTGNVKSEWQGSEVLAPEDQCSICLEALASAPTVALQCKHVFHERCIKDWLKRQSNCPNCRKFALMSDEYPSLS